VVQLDGHGIVVIFFVNKISNGIEYKRQVHKNFRSSMTKIKMRKIRI